MQECQCLELGSASIRGNLHHSSPVRVDISILNVIHKTQSLTIQRHANLFGHDLCDFYCIYVQSKCVISHSM